MSEQQPFNSFSTNTKTFGTSEFLESNSLVAKFAFLLLVIFAFVLLLRIGVSVISYFLQPSTSPKLIDGMVDASQMIVFPQDPSNNDAVTIYRSVNATDGIEFTWSVWIFINNLYDSGVEGQFRHIFHKGNSNLGSKGINTPNNAPGLYISPNNNNLVVIMNTFENINEEIMVPDIPINKWINVIIRCQNTTLDVYVNGTIVRSLELHGVPKQNYGDVYLGMNGGFNGYISNLWYYNYALGTREIQKISRGGPNTKMVGTNNMDIKKSDYLSLRWYFSGSNDSFNP
jgi:Concanavalin A-like lectin/glucanases superfamily